MALKVGDRVRILNVEQVASVWHGIEGTVIGVHGTVSPFHFEVEIPIGEGRPKYLLFKGDELEKIGD